METVLNKGRRKNRNQAVEKDEQQRSFAAECRARGIRFTVQRAAVFRALVRNSNHPTADSLYATLQRTVPSLSLSTVYRILESLEREGMIRKVSTTGIIARYDGNVAPHQHLICRICGRMTDLQDGIFSRLRLPETEFAGFIAEGLDIRIVGTCMDCSRSASGPTGSSKKCRNREP